MRARAAVLAVVSASTLAASTLACRGAEAPKGSEARPFRVAVIPKGTTHEFWRTMHAGALRAQGDLRARGVHVDLVWKGPLREDDREQQVQVVESFAAQGMDGIVLAPLDARALVRPVEDARRLGVPAVIVDSALDSDAIVSFVATDNVKGGAMGADALGRLLGGKGRALLLRYQEGSASTGQREEGFLASGIVGIDPSDLVRATRALYRAGVRLESPSSARFELEASRREISEVFQLLLDTDVVDRVDSLYLFPGDVSDEVASALTFDLKAEVAARIALLGGRVSGEGTFGGALPNEARYWVSSARVDVRPSGTSVAVRYRFLDQDLGTGGEVYRNTRESVDVTLAQEVPIPILRALGSRWQALFSVEMGSRQEGDAEARPNRQMAGGLSLSF